MVSRGKLKKSGEKPAPVLQSPMVESKPRAEKLAYNHLSYGTPI
jgi:hypothetical protein